MDEAPDPEAERLLLLLAELVDRSGRSQRDIERGIGVGHGWLRHVFKRETDLKVQHILQLGKFLGFSPGQFFRQAYPMVDAGDVLDQVRPAIEDVYPPRRGKGQLTPVARREVRLIFREELAKLGLLPAEPPGAAAPPQAGRTERESAR
jgi:hypothetical protein